ncbi:MAG: hypothetical protein A2W11_06355 [Ignavibacteria bacterium RBG_16_35_7]|nr:MAG: hypothetical protein A2W11_06355 [Ignavibacteria bacterium RBG_16_35_7]
MIKDWQLFFSSDFGTTWTYLNIIEQLPPPILPPVPGIVKISPAGTIFCGIYYAGRGSYYSGIAKSTDNGLTWTTPGWDIYGGRLYDFRSDCVITYGVIHNSMTLQAHVYLSEDEGDSWDFLGHAPVYHTAIHLSTLGLFSNGNILTGIPGDPYWVSPYGLFLSVDSSQSWAQVSTLSVQAGLRLESGGMLIGTDSLGVFLFSDEGDNLGSYNEGLTDLNIHSMLIDESDYIYIGTDDGLWRRPLSEIVTSIKENPNKLPLNYTLKQNYPNPFNPITSFTYSIPDEANVTIRVFDITGNEIETLVKEEKPAGTYEIMWNAENLPSGVYFYQLSASEFITTKKMILLK